MENTLLIICNLTRIKVHVNPGLAFSSLFQAPREKCAGEDEGTKTSPPRFRPLVLSCALLSRSLEQAKLYRALRNWAQENKPFFGPELDDKNKRAKPVLSYLLNSSSF